MADISPHLMTLFTTALERPPGPERSAYLDVACGGDAALRAELEALLAVSGRAGGFLEGPAKDAERTVDLPPAAEAPGRVVGPYKLVEQIGEGGMGAVWMAQQTEPVKRLVAVKLIKGGMDSRQVVARFEAERQALALMDHPNIAKVLDGGTTAAGRPYFVMDLVKGVPITRYCDEHHLTPRQRLELFVPVCQAVQHAHQKGIIHRDLKPSNVLVALYDGKPVPKVIDFGVAKAARQSLTDKTLVTGFGTIVGTLEYMSPEQAEINQLDIDTRSDIYSLGVLLYELLAGSPPFSRKELEKAGMLEMLRVIREQEPSKPSTRLSTAEGLPTLAANRGTEPAKLTRLMRGELDWIVMKALEKDRARRYETAKDFGADVERYLGDEPVQACPPTAWYRLRKFTRRNKARLVMATAVVLAVLVAVGSIGWVLRDRSARHAELNYRVELAIEDAGSARDRALSQTDNRFQWEATRATALSALKRGEELAAQDSAALDPGVAKGLRALRAALDADDRDYRFVVCFDEILQEMIVWNARRSESKNEGSFLKLKDAFRSYYGWQVGVTATDEVACFIHERPKPIQEHLLAALDVCLTRAPQDNPQARRWLNELLRAADDDAWRKQARSALAAADWSALEKLLKEPIVSRQRPGFLHVLTSYLPDEASTTKLEMLRRIREAHPGEFWAHGRFTIALSHDTVAWVIANTTDPLLRNEKLALEHAQEAVRLVPNDGDFWSVLGLAHYRVGNWQESVEALEKAMELSNGGRGDDWFILAMAHARLGNKAIAHRWYDRAVDWTQKNNTASYPALGRYQIEAAELLGLNQEK
jgi:serine/threonine protein kinase